MPGSGGKPSSSAHDALSPGVAARVAAWTALREAEKSPPGGGQELLGKLARKARLDSRDRGLAFDIAQGVWRGRRLYDWVLSSLEGFQKASIDPGQRDLLRIALFQYFRLSRMPSYAILHESVEIARDRLGANAAGFCNALLRQLVRQYPNRGDDLAARSAQLPLGVRHSFPDWIVRLVRRTVGSERLESALEALNRPLPLYARANPAVAALEEAQESLSAIPGLECRICADLAPLCLEIDGPAGPVTESDLFRRGGLIVQDASSQCVAEFVQARPDMAVADLCAAPGGKTVALALAMSCRGALVACDVSEERMKRLRQNLCRMGVDSFVRTLRLEEESRRETLAAIRDRLNGGEGADRVLVDAPCSGLGTLRRHPEIRWRLRKSDLKRLGAAQAALLEEAASIVRPGGRIVYSTCSFAAEENDRVVEAFVERRRGEFRVAADCQGLPPCVEQRVGADGWLRTLPGRDETDGVCAVRLERRA